MKKICLSLILLSITLFSFSNNISAQESITTEDVSNHNNPSDCWVIFEDNVYDISNYLPDHDIYLDIRDWCGEDMTEDFKTKADLGRDHKTRSYAMLDDYYIGDLSVSVSTTTEELLPSDESAGEEDHYSVEISGNELKSMTIEEIADLWEIDSVTFLDSIIEEFNLKGNYTADNFLDDLRYESPFTPSQVKIIAEEIKTGETNDSDKTTNTIDSKTSNASSPKNPYNFALPFFGTLFLYLLQWQLTKSKIVERNRIFSKPIFNLTWNSVLLISLIPSLLFGSIMALQYQYTSLMTFANKLYFWHVEGSIIFGTVGLLHLITRLGQFLAPAKNILKKT